MFAAAVATGTILEIDGTPERMDLEGVHAGRAVQLGCKLVIDSDAHTPNGFDDLQWGIAMARHAVDYRRRRIKYVRVGRAKNVLKRNRKNL